MLHHFVKGFQHYSKLVFIAINPPSVDDKADSFEALNLLASGFSLFGEDAFEEAFFRK